MLLRSCFVVIVVGCCFLPAFGQTLDGPYNNNLSIIHIIQNAGYPVELYTNIKTEDDYLLDIQRIPYGRNKATKKMIDRQPILFIPPLLTSAEVFVTFTNNLPFMLADAGFDIWLGNTRGSLYGRKHLHLSTNANSSYWEYSWHEKGIYDLPALIDFVIETTGYEKIFLVGYSEGTTDMFVLGSERPEYNNKIKLAIKLAPSVFLGHTTQLVLKRYAYQINYIRVMLYTMGLRGIYFNHEQLYMLKQLESAGGSIREMCLNAVKLVLEYDSERFHTSPCSLLVLVLHGVSVKELTHYAQLIVADDFRKFDYGPSLNKKTYGTKIPPSYDLKKYTAPIALIFSDFDDFAARPDMERLQKVLPNIVYKKELNNMNFTHYDYVAHPNISKLLYKDLVKLVKSFK